MNNDYLTSVNSVILLNKLKYIEKEADCPGGLSTCTSSFLVANENCMASKRVTSHFMSVLFINSIRRNQWFSIYQVILFTSPSEMKLLAMNRAYLNSRLSIR